MKITLTKRIVSLLAVVALLMTMFTGMVFSVSADDDAVTILLPLAGEADKANWTYNRSDVVNSIPTADVVIGERTYAPAYSLVLNVNSKSERKMTSNSTFDFGNKLKVSGTLVISSFSDNTPAHAYTQAGDFKFIIGDDLTNYYVRAYMGSELVYEKTWPSNENYTIFQQVGFNATIDTEAKTVALDYITGPMWEPVTTQASRTYTGDYSFNGVTCIAAAANNYLTGTDKVNVAVAGFSVTEITDTASSEEVSSEATSSEDVSSDATSSEDTSSDLVVESETDLLPTADASKWTGNVEYIKAEETVIGGVTCTPAGSFVLRDNKNEPKQITTVDTFNLGDNFKVSGTLAGTKFRRSDDFYAYAYAQVGEFKFVIGDERDETDASRPKVMYVRAYMGEELVYEERIMQGNTLGLNIFDQVNFNATIDNNAKTVTLDYTKGAIGALETINGTGTYTGDYSFDAVTATAAAQNNFVATDDAVNVAVAGLSLTKYRVVQSEDTSSDATSSDDTSSETVVETVTNLLPTTNASKWDGDTTYIAPADVVLNNFTYAPAGGFVVNENKATLRQMTTVDAFDLGNKFKLSGTLVAYALHTAEHYIQVYAQAGDFKFEISEGLNKEGVRTLYAKAYMGEEVVHEKSWPQSENTHIFRQVRFNATIDNTAKTVELDYTTGWASAPETNTGSGTYKGDYSFDNATATVAAKNCWYNGTDYVNVGVGELSLTTYKVKEKKPVAFTVLADDETHGTVECTPTGDVYVGDKVTITATAKEGYDFVGWVDQNNKPYYDLSATAEVTVGDINYYKAMFAVANIQSTVTISVKAKSNRVYSYTTNQNPTINGMMATDETIRKVVEDIPGYTLIGWINAETGVPVDASIVQTANILVAPVYTKKVETYAVSIDTVVNNYSFNTLVTAVSENDNFTSWTENDKVVSYAKEYSFFAGCDRTITSVNNGATTAKPVLSVNKAWSDGTYDYVLTEWALPEGYTLIAEGVIVTKDVSVDLVDITLADVDYNKIRVGTTELTTASGQYMIYTNTNVNFAYKAFLIYKDNTGKETTVYNMPEKEVSDYYSTDNWQPVDIVSAELMETTSEGCQWTTNIVMDGEIGFLCADTTGPYKTTDGGQTWKPSSLGWGAGGSQSIAIDPKNPNHVIGAGNCTANANYPDASARNGIYLSYNGGETWKHAAYYCISSPRTYVNQFVFDPTSYNQSKGMCMTIYWSREDYSKNTLDNDPKLYKSTDGGENWSEVKVDADAEGKTGGARHLEIASDGTVGTVFSAVYPSNIGTDTGYNMGTTVLYKLAKKYSWGSSYKWTKVLENVRTFDIQNNVLYVSTTDGFYKSTDMGSSFTKVNENTDYPEYTQMLAVSPSGQNMIMQLGDSATSHSDTYKNKYYSNDGGQTWNKVNVKDQVEQSKGTSFMPVPVRVSVSSFGVADGKEFIVSNFGDTIVRSSDCGATWVNSNKGYNVICTTEIAFNINNQNLMIVPSQDYNGAYSTDGGKTFTYLNWSGKSWGGFTYGGYIFDENNMCVINTDAWWDSATQKHVYTTHDGGVTFNRTSNYSLASDALQVSTGALNNDNIGFVGNLRTTDKGQTFTSMENIYTKSGAKVSGAHIRGVWDVQLDGKNAGRLYGCDSAGFAVYSDDNGETWIQFADLQATSSGRRILGMACDQKEYVYFYTMGTNGGYVEVQKTTVASGRLEDIKSPIDDGKKWNGSLEVDYYNSALYLGCGEDAQPKDSNVPCLWRSEDGGETWVDLSVTLDEDLNKVGNPITELYPGGGVTHIEVNYETNEVFAVFVNHGIWKIGRTR